MSAKRFSLAMNALDARYIEEALTYQVPAKRRRARPFVRAVLAACLAMLLTLGTAMAVSAAFREAVADWVRERYESFTHYAYRGEAAPDTGFVPHRLTELPAGYAEAESLCDADLGQQLTVYRNEAEGKALLVSVGRGGSAFVEAEGCTIRAVEVAGVTGELYVPDDPTRSSAIVWTRGELFFCISGSLSPEELAYYAARLQPEDAPPSQAVN